MTPEKTTEQAVNEKVGIGAYLSLAFAVVFFSGLCASSQWGGASSTSRPSTAASADS